MSQPTQDPRNVERKPPLQEPKQPHPGSESRMRTQPDFGEQGYKGLARLIGRAALITGADSGIGRAVALAYAREGADVAIAYLSEHEDAERTRKLVEEAGRRAVLIAGDLGDEQHCRKVVEQTAKAFGKIDILVNDAAYQGDAIESIEELTSQRIERAFRVNVLAMFNLVRFALPHMKPGACVINVASIQAYHPSPAILDYASTKGAIVTLTKGLSQELMKRGIRANVVAPGPVWTPLVAQSFDEKKLEKFGADTPYGRPAQPAELAPAFVFLASDESRYVNGEVLGVTGGGKPLP